MTVFWDILHYWKLIELAPRHPELTEDLLKIETQVSEMVKAGHDIQLHIHPHWLDTSYDQGKWNFDLTGYRLHSLSPSVEPENIRSITGCITICKNLIESVCRKSNPDHKVIAFRAGGYCIQPFSSLEKPLAGNGIFIDSSVCYGFRFDHGHHSYDFTSIPDKTEYRFQAEVESEDPRGNFIELPIGSMKASPFQVLWWAFLLRTKYKDLGSFGEDMTIENTMRTDEDYPRLSFLSKLISTFWEPRFIMLTPDNFFREKFDYLVKSAKDGAVMILHPKYLNEHTLGLLEKHLGTGRISFSSLNEKYKNNG